MEYIQERQGAVYMRRGRRGFLGCAAIGAGLIIILSLVLPTDFWWFVLAIILISAGIWFLRCC